MVNPQKHKGNQEFIEEETLQNAELRIIHDINEAPQYTIESFMEIHKRLSKYYSLINKKGGKVLLYDSCIEIRKYAMITDLTLDTINYHYHALKLDEGVISAIIDICQKIMELFEKIQARQNKNIDNKRYGGFESVQATEAVNNSNGHHFDEDYEDIIRLKSNWKVKNPNVTMNNNALGIDLNDGR